MVVPRSGRRLPSGGGMLLVPAAAFAVHQLRYTLAYGGRANAELAAQGHSYLSSLVPWTILAVALAGGSFLRRFAGALRAGSPGPVGRLSASGLWAVTWVGLLALYAIQETLEGVLTTGHPGGAGGVVGHGGWWAVPAAASVAALVTLLLLLGRVLLRVAASAPPARYRCVELVAVPAGIAPAVVRPLARAAAGRAPPFRLPSL